MKQAEENRLMIELFTRHLTGDERGAKELLKNLDQPAALRLHNRANEIAVIAETAFFDMAREKRANTQKEDE